MQLLLELNSPGTTRVRRPQTNGFVERFNRTVLDEFLRPALRRKFYPSKDSLQKDLDEWLQLYNSQRTHRGYRNRGKRPLDTVNEYLKSERKEG